MLRLRRRRAEAPCLSLLAVGVLVAAALCSTSERGSFCGPARKGGRILTVGDGNFGTDPRTVDETPRWYNEVEASIQHFWVVDVTKDGIALKAVGADGTVLDSFTTK